MLSDGELLQRYIDEKSEASFNELVQRHLNIVYFAALRRVGLDAHFASDVTQRVFTDLARKAALLKSRPSLAGWLHTATRFTAAEIVRTERRRRTHEQEAHAMNELNAPAAAAPGQIDPVLDEVLDVLSERDRDAILLHFFEGHSFVEVGAALSLSADAARMRVNRALDQLREALQKRGVESSAAALATALTAQSSLAAPASVAGSIAGRALSLAASGTAGIPWLPAGVAAVVILTLGTLIVVRSPTVNSPPVSPGGTVVQPAPDPKPPTEVVSGQRSPAPTPDPGIIEVSGETRTATSATATPVAGAQPGETASEFAKMTDGEKRILKTLWTHAQVAIDQAPNVVWSFGVAATSPSGALFEAGREALVGRGLVRIGLNGLNVALTPLGRMFCAQHDNEITREPLFFTIASPTSPLAAQPAADFNGLLTSEKNILKRLVAIENLHPPVGNTRYGLVMQSADAPPASAFNQAVTRLVSMKFVNIGQQKGIVYLTDAGRAYCAAQMDKINGYQLPERSPE